MDVAPFVGFWDHRLDPKDRVVIPSEFAGPVREVFGGRLYLVPSASAPCLEAYPEPRYREIAAGEVPGWFDEGGNRARRLFFHFTQVVELQEKTGRITIPRRYLRYFPTGMVRVAGMNRHLELWDPEAWEGNFGDEADAFPTPGRPRPS